MILCSCMLSASQSCVRGVQCRKTLHGWLAQARSQGGIFFALCHEVGGRACHGCEFFLDQLCSVAAASPSEHMTLRIFALQRLHAATFRGVAMLINSSPVMRAGPEVPQGASQLPVSPPAPAAGD